MPGFNPGLQCPGEAPTSGNDTMAKQLFQQGLQEEGLTLATLPPIKITYQSDSPTLADQITTMRQMWQSVLGVNVQTDVLDFVPLLTAENNTLCTNPDFHACLNKGLQMWTAAWGADYPDPQDWTTLQFDKYAPNNQGNYGQNGSSDAAQQQQVQQQLEQADVTSDSHTRLQMYNQAEQQLINDVAWLPTDQRFGSQLLKSYVIGQTFNALGLVPPPNAWGNIYVAAH